jgi:hypothetical protein
MTQQVLKNLSARVLNLLHSFLNCYKLHDTCNIAPCVDPGETLRVIVNCLSVGVTSSTMKLIAP